MALWISTSLLIIVSLGTTQARFTPLGIHEFYIKRCERKIVFTTDDRGKCDMRRLEIQIDNDENRNYVKCLFEEFKYFNSKGEFDKSALIKDYHQYGIKDRDGAITKNFDDCMKNYGPSLNPMKILDCITKDKDWPKVINARRERDEWKPEWMQARCGATSLG